MPNTKIINKDITKQEYREEIYKRIDAKQAEILSLKDTEDFKTISALELANTTLELLQEINNLVAQIPDSFHPECPVDIQLQNKNGIN